MATVTPPFRFEATAGGLLGQLFDALPRPFSPNPKAQTVLTFVPTGTPKYAYLSIQNGMLYLHSQPISTPAFTPEVSFDLAQYNFTSLANAITAGAYGYVVYASTQTDGSQSLLLLGFTDFALNGTDSVQVQVATARLWKALYPMAQAFYVASLATNDAQNATNLPFASGFWLDFWGDWFNIPRQPGMSDMQYVAYLLWNMRVPKVNNMAIADILQTQYQVPVTVTDTGTNQFTVYFYPTLMGQSTNASTFINKIKAAGVSYLTAYMASFTENYKTYLYNRYGWSDLSQMDRMAAPTIQLNLQERRYGYTGDLFQFGDASGVHALFNTTTFGGGSSLTDSYTMH